MSAALHRGLPRDLRIYRVCAITLVAAFCSLSYELVIAQTLSVLRGDTAQQFCFTIGIYLASMGVGALCVREYANPAVRLAKCEVALSVLGVAATQWLVLVDGCQRYLVLNYDPASAFDGAGWISVLAEAFVEACKESLARGVDLAEARPYY